MVFFLKPKRSCVRACVCIEHDSLLTEPGFLATPPLNSISKETTLFWKRALFFTVLFYFKNRLEHLMSPIAYEL